MATYIYVANRNGKTLIGVFSTSDLAKEACYRNKKIMTSDYRRLLWMNKGTTQIANAGKTQYTVNILELDAYCGEIEI